MNLFGRREATEFAPGVFARRCDLVSSPGSTYAGNILLQEAANLCLVPLE